MQKKLKKFRMIIVTQKNTYSYGHTKLDNDPKVKEVDIKMYRRTIENLLNL